MILECPALQQMRNVMFNEISGIEGGSGREIINEPGDLLYTLMGKCPEEYTKEQVVKFLSIVVKYVAEMYIYKTRTGVG